MISDELKEALGQRFDSTYSRQEILTMFIKNVEALLPRIVALERCRELLEKHCFVNRDRKSGLSSPICVLCGGVEPNEYDSKHLTGHANDCEIAKAIVEAKG